MQRLMRIIGLRVIYRRPLTSRPAPDHPVYPYLLEKVKVAEPNQIWAEEITYLPMARGFLYLAPIMDWHSRYVVAWRMSNTPRRRSLSAHCLRPRRSVARGWPYNLPLPTVRAELTAELRTNCTKKRLELPADLAQAG